MPKKEEPKKDEKKDAKKEMVKVDPKLAIEFLGGLVKSDPPLPPGPPGHRDQVFTSMTYCLFSLGFFLRSHTAWVSAGCCWANFSSTTNFLSRASPI